MGHLNHENYFTKENKHLSNSKISDWLKSKHYFYKKHISCETSQSVTDAMVLGSAVDTWLTESREEFEKQYIQVTKRSRNGDTPWRYQLNKTMYDAVENMCTSAEDSPALKALSDYETQKILQSDIQLGHFDGIAGIPDLIKIDGDTCEIVDLKTAKTIDPTKYHWHCIDFGYYRQQAMYQILAENIYKCKNFRSRHVVIEKDPDGINHVQTFILNQGRINKDKDFLFQVFESIKNEKDFLPHKASWDDAIEIGGMEEDI